jgi:hypothetical protein
LSKKVTDLYEPCFHTLQPLKNNVVCHSIINFQGAKIIRNGEKINLFLLPHLNPSPHFTSPNPLLKERAKTLIIFILHPFSSRRRDYRDEVKTTREGAGG